jgi:hypothetical protein
LIARGCTRAVFVRRFVNGRRLNLGFWLNLWRGFDIGFWFNSWSWRIAIRARLFG